MTIRKLKSSFGGVKEDKYTHGHIWNLPTCGLYMISKNNGMVLVNLYSGNRWDDIPRDSDALKAELTTLGAIYVGKAKDILRIYTPPKRKPRKSK